jgi:hypothetical protein
MWSLGQGVEWWGGGGGGGRGQGVSEGSDPEQEASPPEPYPRTVGLIIASAPNNG